MVGILCLKFSLYPLRFSLTRETDTKMTKVKSWAIFIFNSWTIKLTKTPILYLQVTYNCSAFGGFCVSVSLVRESLRGLRENLKHKIRPQDTCLLDYFCHSGHSHCGLLHHYCLYHLEKRQTNQNKNQSPQPTQLDIHLLFKRNFHEIWWVLTCSWHQKTKPRIHKFTNSRI